MWPSWFWHPVNKIVPVRLALCVFMNRIQWRSQDFVLSGRLKTLKSRNNFSYVTWGYEAPWTPPPRRQGGTRGSFHRLWGLVFVSSKTTKHFWKCTMHTCRMNVHSAPVFTMQPCMLPTSRWTCASTPRLCAEHLTAIHSMSSSVDSQWSDSYRRRRDWHMRQPASVCEKWTFSPPLLLLVRRYRHISYWADCISLLLY